MKESVGSRENLHGIYSEYNIDIKTLYLPAKLMF